MKTIKQRHTGILYMIEDVDVSNNKIVLADYIFDKKINLFIDCEKVQFYANAFYKAVKSNIFLFLEFDEKEKKIITD